MQNEYLFIQPEVAKAIAENKPVIALESTIISHGMPYPKNVETALSVEDAVRKEGAIPATIAIKDGKCLVRYYQKMNWNFSAKKKMYGR